MLSCFAAVHYTASAGKRPLLELDVNAQPPISDHSAFASSPALFLLGIMADRRSMTGHDVHNLGQPAKKPRASEPELWTRKTQQSQLHDSIVSGSVADASAQYAATPAHLGGERESQTACAPEVAADHRETPVDDFEWSDDDDDPQKLLALIMDTQPPPELSSPTRGTSDAAEAHLRSDDEEVRACSLQRPAMLPCCGYTCHAALCLSQTLALAPSSTKLRSTVCHPDMSGLAQLPGRLRRLMHQRLVEGLCGMWPSWMVKSSPSRWTPASGSTAASATRLKVPRAAAPARGAGSTAAASCLRVPSQSSSAVRRMPLSPALCWRLMSS